MSDRDHRLGRLEGRQEMLIEWVDSIEEDHRTLKQRLSEQGVLDYNEQIKDFENRIQELKKQINHNGKKTEKEAATPTSLWDVSGVFDFFKWMFSHWTNMIKVLAFIFILAALIYFLGWEEAIGVRGRWPLFGGLCNADLLFRRIKHYVDK